MAKVLYCNDLVPGCNFEARGNSEEEVLGEIVDHISTVHHMESISDEILDMVCKAIHEEMRVRWRAASA
jgi:predicted small metal-binding protein